MKYRLIIINKTLVKIILLLLVALLLFLVALSQISINTMKLYDPIYKGNANTHKVALACNVVWGNEYLPSLLEILKANDIKITFFVGGEWAEKNKELLQKIQADGHEIGNHGYKHLKQSQLTREQNIREIQKTEGVVKEITGIQTRLFAPPYGDINELVVQSAESINYKVVMWSIDTIDWNTKDYKVILNRIEKKHHNGAIILMHPTEVMVNALPQMVQTLKKNQYEIVTVSEVLE